MKKILFATLLAAVFIAALPARPARAALDIGQVDAAFREVFKRAPSADELNYWKGRRADKPTLEALKGAMAFQKQSVASFDPKAVKTNAELIKAVAPAFALVYGRPSTPAETAWWQARVRCGSLKDYAALVNSMKFHHSKKVGMGTAPKESFCKPAAASGIASASLGIGGHAAGPIVKIGIWKSGGKVQVTADKAFYVSYENEKKTVAAGQKISVAYADGKYQLSGTAFKDASSTPVKFQPGPGTYLTIANYSDIGASGTNYNRFRGNIIVNKGASGLWAINELRTEDYVKGLAETSDASPQQFQRALAIAARTYVLKHMTDGGRQPQNGFHITNTPNDQWYRGYNYELKVPSFASMARETKGQVIAYADKLISAVYFSGSDGRTRSAEEVWNSSRFPYLQSKKDPYGGGKLLGHGTGLSGRGAIGFVSKDNWDYRKVLTYYYTGVKLVRGY